MEAGLNTAGNGQATILETERLVLRYLTESDVDAIFAVLGDPLAMKNIIPKASRGKMPLSGWRAPRSAIAGMATGCLLWW